jgi:hypothetical protein
MPGLLQRNKSIIYTLSIISEKISEKKMLPEKRDISPAIYEIFPTASVGFIRCNLSSGISREIER